MRKIRWWGFDPSVWKSESWAYITINSTQTMRNRWKVNRDFFVHSIIQGLRVFRIFQKEVLYLTKSMACLCFNWKTSPKLQKHVWKLSSILQTIFSTNVNTSSFFSPLTSGANPVYNNQIFPMILDRSWTWTHHRSNSVCLFFNSQDCIFPLYYWENKIA